MAGPMLQVGRVRLPKRQLARIDLWRNWERVSFTPRGLRVQVLPGLPCGAMG